MGITSVILGAIVAMTQSAEPALPSVAIVPVVNVSSEKWAELKTAVTERAQTTLEEQLSYRKVKVTPKLEVEAACKELQLDFSDEEFWTRANLSSVGQKVGADYVAFVVVLRQQQRVKTNFFTSAPEGEVEIKFWVLNIKENKPIFSAKTASEKARPHSFLGVAKGSDQQKTAADRAVTNALKDFYNLFELTEEGKKKVKKP